MVRLGANRYGKAEVRVVHVARGAGPDGADLLTDRSVSTSLSGALEATHLHGDNASVLATDTQKNTVYAFSKRLGAAEPELLALELARWFTASQEPITGARVHVEQYRWSRIGAHRHSFHRSGDGVRTTTVVHDQHAGTTVVSGVENLVVLSTTDSEFHGFPRDRYTTLAETTDRMLATEVSARWRYRDTELDFAAAYPSARSALLEAFADTYSYSLQQTLFAMGRRILQAVPEICEVRLALPNKHHFPVDLEPFGLTNDNEVYYAADRPYGLIEGTVLADDAPPEGPAWR